MPGLLLRFDFGEATHDLSYEDIKATFRPVAFVEFQKVSCSRVCACGRAWRSVPQPAQKDPGPCCPEIASRERLLLNMSCCGTSTVPWRSRGVVFHMQGGSSGILRFRNKEDADQGFSKADAEGKVSIQDVTADVSRLEGAWRYVGCRLAEAQTFILCLWGTFCIIALLLHPQQFLL